jgi:hypothetical protein
MSVKTGGASVYKPGTSLTETVMTNIREQIDSRIPRVDVDLPQLMEDLIGDLTAVPQPIEVQLYANDPTVLNPPAGKVAAAPGKVDGVAAAW